MATKIFSEEQLNYFRVCHIATDILPQALRFLFKQEWDNRYMTTFGEWTDTPQNGLDFNNGESPGNQRRNARLLATMVNGDRAEWDCTMLFYAILFSDSIHGLSSLIKTNVDDLRKFRNEDFAHMTEGQLSNTDFNITVGKVEAAFRNLGLSTVEIQTVSTQKGFPTDELQNVITNVQNLTQDLHTKDAELQSKDSKLQEKAKELLEKHAELQEEKSKLKQKHAELQENIDRLQTNEEQRKVLEEQLQREVEPFCVLPPRPPHVIARRDCDVAKVTQKLLNLRKTNDSALSYCYISGNPGSGKSQLAGLVVENFYKDAHEDTTAPSFVMTLSAENPEALLTSYLSLARKVSCPAYTITATENSKDLSTEQKIAIIKDLITTKIHLYSSWLLVIDNVTNLARMGQFLPERGNEQWGKGQLLITTQDCSCIPPESSFTSHISLSKGMELADATRLLIELSGISGNEMEEQVAHALDYQPLALASAGVFMRKLRNSNPAFGWEGYLEKLENGKRELTEKELAKVNSIYQNSMTIATRVAVEAVMASDQIMKHAFTFLAFCAPEPLRLDVLTTYVVNADESLDKEEVGIQIQGSSLLLIDDENDVNIRLHKVVHDILKLVVKDRIKTNEHTRVLSVALQSCKQFITKAVPKIEHIVDSFLESRQMVPHLKTLVVGINDIFFNKDTFQVFCNTTLDVYQFCYNLRVLGRFCHLHSEFHSSIEYLSAALTIIENDETRERRPNHFFVASLYGELGELNFTLSDHQQAKEYFELALSIQVNKLGPHHIVVARMYHNIGALKHMIGDHQQAKEFFERALSVQLSKLGPDNVNVANTYLSMGNLQKALGDHQQAKEYYERALSIQLSKLGPDHVNVANTYQSMGNLQKALGDHQQAKEYYERALSIQLSKLGPDHVNVGNTYQNMGNLHSEMADHQQAKEYYERSLSIQLSKLGPDHVNVGNTYQNMGNLHSEMADHQQAKEYYERALSIQLSKLGPDHVHVAVTYHNMGNIHSEMGDHQQAKEYYERALSVRLSKLGPDHVNVANTYQSMGNLQKALGDHQQAEEYYERALSIQLSKLGPNHVDVASTYHNMGILHHHMGDHKQAKEYYERALTIKLNKLGPDHVNVASTYQSMGNLQKALGDHQQAKEYYERALSIQLSKLGADHVNVAGTYHNMGNLHSEMGEHQQAKEYYGRSLSIKLRKLGPDHVKVANTYHNMGKLHHKLGDYEKAKECYQRALSVKRNKNGVDHVDVRQLSRLLADVQRVMDSQQQAPDQLDRTQLNQPQKRGPDQTDFEFAYRKKRREDDFC